MATIRNIAQEDLEYNPEDVSALDKHKVKATPAPAPTASDIVSKAIENWNNNLMSKKLEEEYRITGNPLLQRNQMDRVRIAPQFAAVQQAAATIDAVNEWRNRQQTAAAAANDDPMARFAKWLHEPDKAELERKQRRLARENAWHAMAEGFGTLLDGAKLLGSAKNLNWGQVMPAKPNKHIEDIDKKMDANEKEYDAGMKEYKAAMLRLEQARQAREDAAKKAQSDYDNWKLKYLQDQQKIDEINRHNQETEGIGRTNAKAHETSAEAQKTRAITEQNPPVRTIKHVSTGSKQDKGGSGKSYTHDVLNIVHGKVVTENVHVNNIPNLANKHGVPTTHKIPVVNKEGNIINYKEVPRSTQAMIDDINNVVRRTNTANIEGLPDSYQPQTVSIPKTYTGGNNATPQPKKPAPAPAPAKSGTTAKKNKTSGTGNKTSGGDDWIKYW
jgi:hypothetical protein